MTVPKSLMRLFAPIFQFFVEKEEKKCFIWSHWSRTHLFYFEPALVLWSWRSAFRRSWLPVNLDTKLPELAVKSGPVDAKNLCAFFHVATGSFKRLDDYVTLDFFQRQRLRSKNAVRCYVEILEFFRQGRNRQFISLTEQYGTLDDALQLTYIPGPVVVSQPHNSIWREVPDVFVILPVIALQ